MEIIVKPILMQILKERNMTQTQLSEISGVPQGSISRFDKNDRHVDWHIFAIAKALNINVHDLFKVDYKED
ncbi:helix-turn-helix domain-containing protein [Heyndrickxia ginsengihumi]|uniref:helix-turn-helix domain-containing protein n=1 Tax=Heyndrickxia ginsengihumi TaxID=363870 RepID=UPI0004705EE5|nr:helix-turn-helix transcriptional regulator [Heyndrickxia ginsengihumi]